MATATQRKSTAYEQGVREGRADKSKKGTTKMEKGEGKAHESTESPQEEAGEGPEPDDAPTFGSRKRSAKDAKNTKAPMDAECGAGPGKKCSACKSGKPCSGRAMKDAGCGMKKMDSALTPHEYLAACDLGIQDRGRSYIRARLDSNQRLDLKCGNGSISKGEKCTKGATSKSSSRNKTNGIRSVLENAAVIAGTGGSLYNGGQAVFQLGKGNLEGAKSALQREAAFGALSGAGVYARGARIGSNMLKERGKSTMITSAVVGGLASLNRSTFSKRGVRNLMGKSAAFKGKLTQHKQRTSLERAFNSPGRRDATYASGFSLDLDQLAI
jgi:hypothetical protein